jgi:hypothetical protein
MVVEYIIVSDKERACLRGSFPEQFHGVTRSLARRAEVCDSGLGQ